jgi:hypothetical protein
MKERLRFAIREGGKIRGAGVAKDKSITLNRVSGEDPTSSWRYLVSRARV